MAALLRYCPACHSWHPFYRFFYRSTGRSRHRWHRRCHVCKQSAQPGAGVPPAVPSSPAGAAPVATASPVATPAGQTAQIAVRPAEQL